MTLYEYGLIIGLVGLAGFFLNPFFKVVHGYVYIIERGGRFLRLAHAGPGWHIPLLDTLKGPISLRILQLETTLEGKTSDDVFVNMQISVQYKVLPDKIYEAFYTLLDPEAHIRSFIQDIARSQIPKIKLNDLFDKKEALAQNIQKSLTEHTAKFGFEVIQVFITDISPDPHVKAAMNAFTESQRLRFAAEERSKTEKILKHSQLEIEVETKLLEGKGLAGQWKMILTQLQTSLEGLQKTVPNLNPKDVLDLLTGIQSLEIKKEIALIERNSEVEQASSEPSLDTREAVIQTATGLSKQMLEKWLPGGEKKEEKKV